MSHLKTLAETNRTINCLQTRWTIFEASEISVHSLLNQNVFLQTTSDQPEGSYKHVLAVVKNDVCRLVKHIRTCLVTVAMCISNDISKYCLILIMELSCFRVYFYIISTRHSRNGSQSGINAGGDESVVYKPGFSSLTARPQSIHLVWELWCWWTFSMPSFNR